jgi:2'-5' RNA ligase
MTDPARRAVDSLSDAARLFLALWPDPQTRNRLVACRDAWCWPAGAAVVPPQRLHLTLHFIGAVARPRLASLADALGVTFRPFELELGVLECWPRGLAVLRPFSVPEGLRDLLAALGERLRAQGLPVEARDFRPHVTLARKAVRAVAPVPAPELSWPVASYTLVESLPGAGYRVLRTYPVV